MSGAKGFDAVELFEQNEEREFVIHGMCAELPHGVGLLTNDVGVSLCPTEKECDSVVTLFLPFADLLCPLSRGLVSAAFVKRDTQATVARLQGAFIVFEIGKIT